MKMMVVVASPGMQFPQALVKVHVLKPRSSLRCILLRGSGSANRGSGSSVGGGGNGWELEISVALAMRRRKRCILLRSIVCLLKSFSSTHSIQWGFSFSGCYSRRRCRR